ncbi:MAG: peptide ABC transporter substrate-binding protein [Oscillospiraceae bacterium]|nr:peptide ABC transporter substrate-binding protein [Oscillospiraceae bacterium]
MKQITLNKWKRLSALLLALVMAFALVSCGSTSDGSAAPSASAPASDAEPAAPTDSAAPAQEGDAAPAQESASSDLAADQTLNLLLSTSTVNVLEPNGASWVGEAQIYAETQAGLLRIVTDEDGNDSYVADGAEDYVISDDGLTYTFYLRDNTWSDGVPVTAQDYVYSFFRNLDPENGFSTTQYVDVKNAQAYYDGEITDPAEVGISAPDDHTVVYTLEHPNSEFIYYLAYRSGFPARQDVIEAATSQYGTDYTEMVFSGPFKITSWVKDNSVTLEKNETYWDADNVYLNTVKFQLVPEISTQATLFDAQQLDVVEYNDDYGEDWLAQADAGQIRYISKPGAYSNFLMFACENGGNSGLMGSAKIRLALSLAIDRQELVDVIWGRNEAAYTYVPPACLVGTTEFNVTGEGLVKELQAQYATDEQLQALFQEGLTELNSSLALSDVYLDFVRQSNTLAEQNEVEYLAQTWERRLGIHINVVNTPDDEERQQQMDYDIGLNSWEGGASPYDYLFVVNVPFGLKYLTGVYTNEEVNGLLANVTAIPDETEQANVYHQIENIILEEGGVGPLYFTDIRYFVQTDVQGLHFTNFGAAAIEFSHAYIAAE